MMFGRYDYTYQYLNDEISLGIEKIGDNYRYFREIAGGKRVEKMLLSDSGRILVNPVEPLNLPENVTHYMEIEFPSLFIEPFSKKELYLTFPIEIGVFVAAKKDIQVLDIFSFNYQKYSLYGTPSDGIITRWYWSEVYTEIPEMDHNKFGILKLILVNNHREWVEISRVVLDGNGMKIYYGDVVSMIARMKILTQKIAETEFTDTALVEGQMKSLELYMARELQIVKRSFTMEWGFV
jgi:hypothetical protein